MQISNRDHLVLTDELEAILEFNTKVNDKYKIHTNIMPAPFMGDVKNAPVVILALNPGFDQKEQERGFYNEYKIIGHRKFSMSIIKKHLYFAWMIVIATIQIIGREF